MQKRQPVKFVHSYTLAFDLKYITQEQFNDAYELADKSARQVNRFAAYLEANPRNKRVREDAADYNTDV